MRITARSTARTSGEGKTTQQNEGATGGSFTITELDACGIALTFDLTFSSGDHVTGSAGARRAPRPPTAAR